MIFFVEKGEIIKVGGGSRPCGFKLDPIWQFGGQGGGSAKIRKFFFHASEAPWWRSAKIRKSENFRNFPKKRATSKENAELESRKFEKFENPKEDAELESRKSEKSENSKENAELESENPKIRKKTLNSKAKIRKSERERWTRKRKSENPKFSNFSFF